MIEYLYNPNGKLNLSNDRTLLTRTGCTYHIQYTIVNGQIVFYGQRGIGPNIPAVLPSPALAVTRGYRVTVVLCEDGYQRDIYTGMVVLPTLPYSEWLATPYERWPLLSLFRS